MRSAGGGSWMRRERLKWWMRMRRVDTNGAIYMLRMWQKLEHSRTLR
ncbi:hypothetical protein Hanom_Chr14g01316551 [Helianthus anomalus]